MLYTLNRDLLQFVFLQDPAISSTQHPGTYPPYDTGIAQDIFIKDSNGKPLVGKVTILKGILNSRYYFRKCAYG